MPTNTQIDSLWAEGIVTQDGEETMGIFVNSFDATGYSRNNRYKYKETYKIIAPEWKPQGLVVVTDKIPQLNELPRCISTKT